MILQYYVDVSGKESTAGERVVTAAGYLGSESHWNAFEHFWRVTLDYAQLDWGEEKPYFHATEFFGFQGPFAPLKNDPAKHKELAALFALCAHAGLPYGFSSSLDLCHFGPIFRRACRGLKTPHDRIPAEMVAVSEVCSQVARRCLPPGGLQAQMFIEAGDGVGEILDWLRDLKARGEGWTGAFVGFDQLSGGHYPLQAADYLAHESWHEARLCLRDPKRTWNDITREQFKLLVAGPTMLATPDAVTVDVRYATEEHFRASAPKLAEFIKEHPEYQRSKATKRQKRKRRRAFWRDVRGWFRARRRRIWYGWLGMKRR